MFWKKPKKNLEEKDSIKEERFIPDSLKSLNLLDKEFITGELLKNNNIRLYFAAYYSRPYYGVEKKWNIISINYVVGKKGEIYTSMSSIKSRAITFDKALETIGRFEKHAKIKLKMLPIKNMGGNSLEIANLHGGFFDKNGLYRSIKEKKIIDVETSFRRSNLVRIYNNAKEREKNITPNLNILTWEDLYNKLINRHSLEIKSKSLLKHETLRAEWYISKAKDDIAKIKIFQKTLLDDKESLRTKSSILDSMVYHNIFYGSELLTDLNKHYRAFVFLSLIRTAAKMYNNIVKAPIIKKERIESLRLMNSAIKRFAKKDMFMSEDDIKVLTRLIIQGKDPYKHRSTPFEKSVKKIESLKKKSEAKYNSPKKPNI